MQYMCVTECIDGLESISVVVSTAVSADAVPQ